MYNPSGMYQNQQLMIQQEFFALQLKLRQLYFNTWQQNL